MFKKVIKWMKLNKLYQMLQQEGVLKILTEKVKRRQFIVIGNQKSKEAAVQVDMMQNASYFEDMYNK